MTRLVLHHAGDVIFRVGKLGDLADTWDIDDGRTHLATRTLDCSHAFADGTNADRTTKTVQRTWDGGTLAFGDQTMRDTGITFRSGNEEIKIRRSGDLESPAEYLFVESARPLDIAGENLKMRNGIGHACPFQSTGRVASPKAQRFDKFVWKYDSGRIP